MANEREGPPDRRSVWTDPRTWMTVFGLGLTACSLLLAATVWIGDKMLTEMKQVNANITDLKLTTSNAFTLQGSDINHLKDDQKEIRAALREQNAYNLAMNGFGREIVTTLRLRGVQTPNVPDPPKLGE